MSKEVRDLSTLSRYVASAPGQDQNRTNGGVIQLSSSTPSRPALETVVQTIQARFRADLPYSYIGSSTLLILNPNRVLANLSDASAEEYRNHQPTRSSQQQTAQRSLEPHPYDLAGRAWRLLKARGENQCIVYTFVSSSFFESRN